MPSPMPMTAHPMLTALQAQADAFIALRRDLHKHPELCFHEQRTADVAASLRYVAAWNSEFLPSRDLKEGISAMFAKREPNFTGE